MTFKFQFEFKSSFTGLFSFFVVPILLGDITLDFMSMIDVMVDVMVTATGTISMNLSVVLLTPFQIFVFLHFFLGMDDGMGGNNNNNNNNNENMNRRKRSKKRDFRKDKMETYDSVLDSCKKYFSDDNKYFFLILSFNFFLKII